MAVSQAIVRLGGNKEWTALLAGMLRDILKDRRWIPGKPGRDGELITLGDAPKAILVSLMEVNYKPADDIERVFFYAYRDYGGPGRSWQISRELLEKQLGPVTEKHVKSAIALLDRPEPMDRDYLIGHLLECLRTEPEWANLIVPAIVRRLGEYELRWTGSIENVTLDDIRKKRRRERPWRMLGPSPDGRGFVNFSEEDYTERGRDSVRKNAVRVLGYLLGTKRTPDNVRAAIKAGLLEAQLLLL